MLVRYSSFPAIRVEALGFVVGKLLGAFCWLRMVYKARWDGCNDLSGAVVIYLYRPGYDVSVI